MNGSFNADESICEGSCKMSEWLGERFDYATGSLRKGSARSDNLRGGQHPYLRQHNLTNVLRNAVDALADTKPANPNTFLADYLTSHQHLSESAQANSLNSSNASTLGATFPLKTELKGEDKTAPVDDNVQQATPQTAATVSPPETPVPLESMNSGNVKYPGMHNKTIGRIQTFLREMEEHLVATMNEWSAPEEAAFDFLRSKCELSQLKRGRSHRSSASRPHTPRTPRTPQTGTLTPRIMNVSSGSNMHMGLLLSTSAVATTETEEFEAGLIIDVPEVLVNEPEEDVDAYSSDDADSICEVCSQKVDDDDDDADGDGHDDCEENQAFRSHIAEGVCETLFILKESLLGCNRGEVDVQLHVSNHSPKPLFARVIEQFEQVDAELSKGTGLTLMHFPVRSRRDEYRQLTTSTHMLMWAQMSVFTEASDTTEAKRFEIFVNVLGYCSRIVTDDTEEPLAPENPSFDYYEIIPSFGQLVNVQNASEHRKLCNPETVVRARSLCEAVHHFKLSLVKVAEHIIQTVIQGEFLQEVSHRMSKISSVNFHPPSWKGHSSKTGSGLGARRKSVSDVVEEMKHIKRQPSGALSSGKPRRQSAPTVRATRSNSANHLVVAWD